MGDLILGTRQSSHKARVVKGFQKIVQCPCLERAQCMFLMRRYEDDGGRQLIAEHLQDVEAPALRHLHVEKDQIGFGFLDRLQRLDARRGLLYSANVRIPREEYRHIAPRQRLIIDYESPNRGAHRAPLAGSVTTTDTPTPSTDLNCRPAALPCRISSRVRRFASPTPLVVDSQSSGGLGPSLKTVRCMQSSAAVE